MSDERIARIRHDRGMICRVEMLDTKTGIDTEPFEREMVPVIIIETDVHDVGPCYCTSVQQVADVLTEILGDDEQSWHNEWANDCSPFIHIRTGLRERSWVEKLPPWEL